MSEGNPIRSRRGLNPRPLVIAHDLVMVVIAWALARVATNWLFPGMPPPLAGSRLLLEANLVLIAQGFILWRAGLYRGLWRFASLPDLGNLLRAAILGALVSTVILWMLNTLMLLVALMAWIFPTFLLLLLGLPRLSYRMLKDMRQEVRQRRIDQRTVILGAGRSGRLLVPELERRGGYDIIGFLDDDKRLHGKKIRDVPVLGAIDSLPKIARQADINLAAIAIPSASNQQMQRIVEICENAGIEFKTLPTLKEMGAKAVRLNELKPVALDDLLGRDPVSLDLDAIRAGLTGKRVLVTGGGGSIGSELCRQIARLDPANLIILDNSEYNLYRVDARLRGEFGNLVFDSVLGDICDSATVEKVIERERPEVIFHAAAYKHLPMLQNQIREAFRNNVIGTMRVADAARRHMVETFVLISTDKAVNSSNVMGATKRAAELYCQYANQYADTRFITVRFGNVLNSTGSVVPLFKEQIRGGGPVTVTHPEISRYFMTIPEAGQLILQSAVLGSGGEIFVLDMGEPVRINYLAEQLIRLAGLEPEEDIKIVYTGLRPGEKLFEELFHEHESYGKTGHEKILLAHSGGKDMDWVEEKLKNAETLVRGYDGDALYGILVELIPELAREDRSEERVVSIEKVRGG